MRHKKTPARAWYWGLLLLLCWGAPAPAHSQPKDNLAKAKVMFEQGETYYKAREFERSLYFYREAYLLSLEPSMLFNMGQCYRQLGLLQEAIESYRAFLRDSPATHVLRPKAELLLREVEAELKPRPASRPTPEPASQPTSAPALQPTSTTTASQPTEPEIQPASSLPAGMSSLLEEPRAPVAPWLFYGGAGLSGATALGFGALALSASREARRLQEQRDFDAIKPFSDKAKRLGVVSDLFLLSSLSFGVAGFVLQRKASDSK